MKKKVLFIGMVLLTLMLTTGTFAYTYTNSNTALQATLANGTFATYEVSAGQPDWNSVLPGSAFELLIPSGCGDTTQIPTQYPCSGQHWDKVDDQPTPDELTTYVSTSGSSNWKKDVYALSNYVVPSGDESIASVVIYYCFASSGSYSVSAKPAIITNDEYVEGSTSTTSNPTFTTVSWELTENPVTEDAWTWEEINDLQAGVNMRGYSSTKPAICTQVYVKVNYSYCSLQGDVPHGDLFMVNPDVDYSGDLLVKVYITNVADLLKAYKYLNMKLFVANSVEGSETPNYQLLSLENGVVMFNINGGSASYYKVQIIGGSYNLMSDDPNEWGVGWTVIPEFYCEVSQR
jgi:hypothetical protein